MATIGLKEIKIASLTTDTKETLAYGTIKDLAPAMEATIEPSVETAELYADDVLIEQASVVSKIEMELNLSELPLELRAELLGNTVTKGILSEKAGATPPYFAIGFKAEMSDGKYKYFWITKAKAQPVGDSAKSKEAGITYQTDKIKFIGSARINDGMYRLVGVEGATGFPTDWYTAGVLDGTFIKTP